MLCHGVLCLVFCRTFAIEDDYGRARVMQQGMDSDAKLQEAIDTCPVNCIHWVSHTATFVYGLYLLRLVDLLQHIYCFLHSVCESACR